ncbi:hypothetical protein FACS189452_09030 [Bacteroidia bacterium]|nr:hypothetical protein FACS189452_09030 [Bacteroidia bacterium]
MKKTSIVLATGLLSMFFVATGCSEDNTPIIAPMTGIWQCTGIGGTAFGNESAPIDSKYFKLFSISYAGAGGTGFYFRVGTGDITADVTGLVSDKGNDEKNALSSFLSNGSITYTANTIKQISTKNGVSITQEFDYEITPDGKTLTLIEKVEPLGGQAASVLATINAFLASPINATVGVKYTYTKTTAAGLTSLFK